MHCAIASFQRRPTSTRWRHPAAGTGLLDGQCGSFGPCGLEVLVARSIPYHRDRRFVIGVMDVEPGLGDALAGWRAPHRTAGRFAGTAAITGEIGEGLEGRYAMRCVVGHLRYDCELRLQVS
jgi:hypothetical protein